MSRMNGRLVYLHMPKTGGTWVGHLLPRFEEGTSKTNICHESLQHLHETTPSSRGKFTFGTVRNPWDWYLSWWQHGMNDRIDREHLEVYGRGSTDFRDVLWGTTHAPELEQMPKRMGALWPMYRPKGEEDRMKPIFQESGVGLWSWMTWYMYGDPVQQSLQVHALVETARLHEGICEILGRRFDEGSWPPRNTRQDRPNTAVQGDPRALYDAEMIQWVWEADGALARSLGYTEPFQPLPEAVLRLRPPPTL